jgi:CO/xanthine dehydrogenase FAD-binding subunit
MKKFFWKLSTDWDSFEFKIKATLIEWIRKWAERVTGQPIRIGPTLRNGSVAVSQNNLRMANNALRTIVYLTNSHSVWNYWTITGNQIVGNITLRHSSMTFNVQVVILFDEPSANRPSSVVFTGFLGEDFRKEMGIISGQTILITTNPTSHQSSA